MFCRFCGNNVTSDSVFCPKCGKKIGEDLISAKAFNTVNSKSIIHEHKVFILVYIVIFIFGVLIYSYKLVEDWKHSYYDNVAFEKTFFIIAFFILPLLFYFVLQVFRLKIYLYNFKMQFLRFIAFLIDFVIVLPIAVFIGNPGSLGYEYPDKDETFYVSINISIMLLLYLLLTNLYLNGKIGYKVLRLKVVSNNDNVSVSLKSKYIRTLFFVIETLSYGILTLVSFFNREGKTLSDMISATKVVKINSKNSI